MIGGEKTRLLRILGLCQSDFTAVVACREPGALKSLSGAGLCSSEPCFWWCVFWSHLLWCWFQPLCNAIGIVSWSANGGVNAQMTECTVRTLLHYLSASVLFRSCGNSCFHFFLTSLLEPAGHVLLTSSAVKTMRQDTLLCMNVLVWITGHTVIFTPYPIVWGDLLGLWVNRILWRWLSGHSSRGTASNTFVLSHLMMLFERDKCKHLFYSCIVCSSLMLTNLLTSSLQVAAFTEVFLKNTLVCLCLLGFWQWKPTVPFWVSGGLPGEAYASLKPV